MNYREKNTKIVATISDLRCDVEFLQTLYDKGMDVVRLNTAHQDEEGTLKVVENVRKVSDKIPLLLDTKGPEMRTTDMEPFEVEKGQKITVSGKAGADVQINFEGFAQDVPVGAKILINDGEFLLHVVDKNEHLVCEVQNGGTIKKKKTVNVPDISMNLPSISKKDDSFIRFAVKHNLDFIAHSFVRKKEDVLAVQKILDEYNSNIKIIAKIENREGVENIDEILDVAYGVMVARGDLGVEIPAAEIPLIQKRLIKKCTTRARPVIVATHMLESMIEHPRATRAEVSDVANAILDGTSAIMLSGETAYGKYPIEAVETMSAIALDLKARMKQTVPQGVEPVHMNDATYLAKTAAQTALDLDVDAIIVPSVSGKSARVISGMRIRKPIFAPCYDETIMRQLALSHGIRVGKLKQYPTSDELVHNCIKYLVEHKEITMDSKILVLAGTPAPHPHRSNFIEVSIVKDILAEYEK